VLKLKYKEFVDALKGVVSLLIELITGQLPHASVKLSTISTLALVSFKI
jgi:hypothetical protein